MNKTSDSKIIHISAACLLLSVAEADEILEDNELAIIIDILHDFFSINIDYATNILKEAKLELNQSTGLFEFGSNLNKAFSHDDKLDFINCIFEVAFADGNLHYLEHHTVKKIANILSIEKEDILLAKAEAKNYLN